VAPYVRTSAGDEHLADAHLDAGDIVGRDLPRVAVVDVGVSARAAFMITWNEQWGRSG
jgi:hypothetical protein